MEQNTNTPHNHAGSIRPDPSTPDGRDLLISRVIDAEASGDDWHAFRMLAERDPAVWRELASAQEQHELLCDALRSAVHGADAVDLPELVGDTRPFQRRLDTVGRWGGWAAAAAVLLVFTTGRFQPDATQRPSSLQTGSLVPAGTMLGDASPDQALQQYMDAGQRAGVVVGEVPDRLVIETTPQPDGSVEVVYLRQIIERRVTDRVFREVLSDSGRPIAVPVPPSSLARPTAQ